MNDAQTRYAVVSARVELRLAELREALDRHEAERRWNETNRLELLERWLARLTGEIERR